MQCSVQCARELGRAAALCNWLQEVLSDSEKSGTGEFGEAGTVTLLLEVMERGPGPRNPNLR